MLSATDVKIRDLEYKLRVDKADQYRWLRTSTENRRRMRALSAILGGIAARLSWKRSERSVAQSASAVRSVAARFGDSAS
jgi:hypothetical protein